MGIVKTIKSLFGLTFGGVNADNFQSARSWDSGNDFYDATGVACSEPFRQHPTVSLAISTVASDAATIEWELFANESDQAIEEHPLLDLWQKPNKDYSSSDLWQSTYALFKLYGEVFWWYPSLMIGATGNAPRATQRNNGELYVVHPASVNVEAVEGILRYTIRIDNVDVRMDPERLTHFKRFNPYNPLRGLSELDALGIEINADYNAAVWNKTYFGPSNGVPTGIIIPAKESIISPDDRESFLARWNAGISRKKTAGMLPPGWDWKDVGLSQKEMDFRTLREYSRELILAGIGVPPFLAGVLDKANYANAREQKDVYWLGTISRLLAYFQLALNDDFLPKVGLDNLEVYPKWETLKALTENLDEKVTVAQKLFAMGFTKRQINDRLELGIDVDTMEDADVSYLSAGLMPVDQILNPPEPAPIETPAPTDPNAPEPEDEEEPAPTEPKGIQRRDIEARRTAIWRSVSSRTRDLEGRMNSVVRSHLKDIEKLVLANVEGMKGWLASRRGKTAKDAYDLLAVNMDALKRKLSKDTQPIYTQAIMRGGNGVIGDMELGIAFNFLDPRVTATLVRLSEKIKGIDNTVEKALRESLSEGLTAGENPVDLAARVRQVMDVSQGRSMTIARTEVGSAYSSGRMAGMQQAGVERHQWISARDDRVRDDHAPGTGDDGVDVPIGQAFPTTGLMYPHDPNGAASEVINCRCITVPFLAEPAPAGQEG